MPLKKAAGAGSDHPFAEGRESRGKMLPAWLTKTEDYAPPAGDGAYIFRSIRAMGQVLAGIQIQRGHEKAGALPALLKFLFLVALLVLISAGQSRLLLLAAAAGILVYLCFWPGRDILRISRAPLAAGALAFLLLLPAMFTAPGGRANQLALVCKVVLCALAVNIFNHTTQWNHITAALRRLHIPGVFVFIIDITLKYIALLGTLITELLTALRLRSVGKNDRKYVSVGGVMGVTFMRSAEMSREMVEAMRCRGFTDDYEGL